jgi:hypothetical protein
MDTGGMAGSILVNSGSEIIFAPSAFNNTFVKYTINYPTCVDPSPAPIFDCRNATWVATGSVTLSSNTSVRANLSYLPVS